MCYCVKRPGSARGNRPTVTSDGGRLVRCDISVHDWSPPKWISENCFFFFFFFLNIHEGELWPKIFLFINIQGELWPKICFFVLISMRANCGAMVWQLSDRTLWASSDNTNVRSICLCAHSWQNGESAHNWRNTEYAFLLHSSDKLRAIKSLAQYKLVN